MSNLTDAENPTFEDAEKRIKAWLFYKDAGCTVESYELKCLLVVYAELKALREVMAVVREARTEGWYEESPLWEPVDKFLGLCSDNSSASDQEKV